MRLFARAGFSEQTQQFTTPLKWRMICRNGFILVSIMIIVTVDFHKCHGNISWHDRFLTLTRSASSLSHFYSYLNSIVSNKWHCLKVKIFEKMEFPLDTKNHRVIIIVFFLCLLMLWDGYISFKVFDRSSDKIIWNLFKPLEKTISKIIIHIVLAEEKKTTKERKP